MKTVSANNLIYKYFDEETIIIDVRNPLEYNKLHIPKSFNIPFDKLINNCLLYLNKDFTYYIICSTGDLSKKACTILESKGYKVVNIANGIKSWKGPTESTKKVSY